MRPFIPSYMNVLRPLPGKQHLVPNLFQLYFQTAVYSRNSPVIENLSFLHYYITNISSPHNSDICYDEEPEDIKGLNKYLLL